MKNLKRVTAAMHAVLAWQGPPEEEGLMAIVMGFCDKAVTRDCK